MGYRGSKSDIFKLYICKRAKSIRLLMHFSLEKMHLRCILMDFERNYLVKTFSKQLIIHLKFCSAKGSMVQN